MKKAVRYRRGVGPLLLYKSVYRHNLFRYSIYERLLKQQIRNFIEINGRNMANNTIYGCVPVKNIYVDKISGKDFKRPQYQELLKKIHSDEDRTKAIEIINESQYITDKSKHTETVRKDKAIKNADEIKERKKYISEIEEQIRHKEIYLESLYHGHRCPIALVLCGILLLMGIITLTKGGIYILFPGAVGLIISGICGRPSTRPAIPETQKDIQYLKQELNRLKSGGQITTQGTMQLAEISY